MRHILSGLFLLSFGALTTLGPAAQAAEKDPFEGLSFCEVHNNYTRWVYELHDKTDGPSAIVDQVEKNFADEYVEGLRTGKLVRPSVAHVPVPLAQQGGEVVVRYDESLRSLSLSGAGVVASSEYRLDSTRHDGLRLELHGSSGTLFIDKSVSRAGLKELYIFVHGENNSVILNGSSPCTLVDGGREHTHQPLKIDASGQSHPYTQGGEITTSCINTIYGGDSHDTLYGSDACGDDIYGRKGNDTIFGLAGFDRLHGEEDSDTSYGNTGTDCLYPGSNNYRDYLYGGRDNDKLASGGWSSPEYCYGDEGEDICMTACYFKSSCERGSYGTISCSR